MKIIISLLLIGLSFNSAVAGFGAETDTTDYIAEERWDGTTMGVDYDTDSLTWWGIKDGVKYSGIGVCSSQSGTFLETQEEISMDAGQICWCKLTAPYNGYYVSYGDIGYNENYDGSCEMFCNCSNTSIQNGQGAYTYDANKIMQFHNILLTRAPSCHLRQLKTSTGLSIYLNNTKNTSPALHVNIDGEICYGNLVLGHATNTINIQYNNAIYHLEN